MKKFLPIVLALVLAFTAMALVACGEQTSGAGTQQQDDGSTSRDTEGSSTSSHTTHNYGAYIETKKATYNAPGEETATCSCGAKITRSVAALVPNSSVLASGIQSAKNKTTKNYDFTVTFSGTATVVGYSGNLDAVYDGKYRYNSETDELRFKRTTSGILLKDGTEYIYTNGDSRLKVAMDSDNVIKKISVTPQEDDELNMINLPYVKIIESLSADNLENVGLDTSLSGYRFSANMKISTSFAPINLLLGKVAKMGTNLSIKNVTFTNPQGGVKLYFNLTDDGQLAGYTFTLNISFPVKGVPIALALEYSQKDSASTISLPNVKGYISDSAAIASKVITINNAINAVKTSSAYSLDMTAKNVFDAGWNHLAVVDQYISRMYKNTNDERVDFNHSFVYKSHTEEDGQESFQYTVGNTINEGIYEISRKGSNTQTALPGVTADDRFAIHVQNVLLDADKIDFIEEKRNTDGSTTYIVFLKDSATTALQSNICDLINGNGYDGVMPVENYFDEDSYSIESGDYFITIKDGKMVSCEMETVLRYIPTGGEYSDAVVTLKNRIELLVDEKLDKAREYIAPKKVDTTLGNYGLNNSKYYIL